ncbi:MAG TPA: hypothetical protein VF432_27995 [Thermoanaerobaculia bacterium]
MEDLRDELARGEVLVVVGTGVSIQATGGAEANCIRSLGDIAFAEGRQDEAMSRYHAALALYERIRKPFSIGHTHRRLVRLATDEDSRTAHVTAAREAWRSIKRDDLVTQLDAEFGGDKA